MANCNFLPILIIIILVIIALYLLAKGDDNAEGFYPYRNPYWYGGYGRYPYYRNYYGYNYGYPYYNRYWPYY